MRSKTRTHHRIVRDLLIVAAGVLAAVAVTRVGVVERVISVSEGAELLGGFVAGIFFTSLFTIAPAGIALATISSHADPVQVALVGALGAMLGDLVLFAFVRDVVADDLIDLLNASKLKRYLSIFKLRMFHWIVPLAGAVVIASPLPDEIGVAMMGFSKMRTGLLLPVSFVMNFVGILALAYAARAVGV